MAVDDLDFIPLRLAGLKRLQELTGDEWTDYNLHDPGVTLLEVLVFGLTDLAYRIDFDTAELLAGPAGLDLAELALKAPEAALPSRPSTDVDLRGALLDQVVELENVWIRPAACLGPNPAGGLVDILVWTGHGVQMEDHTAILEKTRRAYDRIRPLGEDADRIVPVHEVRCRLFADVEIERDRNPSEIAAEIYFRCAGLLARGAKPRALDDLKREGLPLDEILKGPLGHYGIYTEAELEAAADGMRPSDLRQRAEQSAPQPFFRAVGTIDDVLFIRELRLEIDEAHEHHDPREPTVVELALPGEADVKCAIDNQRFGTDRQPVVAKLGDVQLKSRGRDLPVELDRLLQHFNRLQLETTQSLRMPQRIETIVTRPQAAYRPFSDYTLVQDHLPQAYNVSQRGLAASAPVDVRARARQLRGYLLQFEQPLADSLANLGSLDELYAPRGIDPTYRSASTLQNLLPKTAQDLVGPADQRRGVLADYDDVFDRRGRILDYLLALYGEAFSQNSLRTFDFYRSAEQRWAAVLANRERFLASVDTLIQNRGGGPDLHGDADAGGFAQRLAVLLEMRLPTPDDLLGTALSRHNLELPPAHDPSRGTLPEVDRQSLATPDNPMDELVPLTEDHTGAPLDDVVAELRQSQLLVAGILDPWVLDNGIAIDRYRLIPTAGAWRLVLEGPGGRHRPDNGPYAVSLGVFADRPEAIRAANQLRRALIGLARSGEGFYVLEHVLLRPRSADRQSWSSLRLNDQLLRVSVVLPTWTPRLHDPGFRKLVEETVAINAPAHVVAECVWLDDEGAVSGTEKMIDFEFALAAWREQLRSHLATITDPSAPTTERRGADTEELEARAEELLRFVDRATVAR